MTCVTPGERVARKSLRAAGPRAQLFWLVVQSVVVVVVVAGGFIAAFGLSDPTVASFPA